MADSSVLFDLDGVIVDSRIYHLAAWEELARNHALAAPPGYFQSTFGMRNDAILGRLLPDAAPAEIDALAYEKEAAFREKARGRLAPLPGVRGLLRWLHEQAIPAAVVTSTPRANLDLILGEMKIAGVFGALVSAEDVRHGKPDPEGFLTGAARLGAPPAACVVIEDAPAGLAAARAAGMRCIGVTTTHPAAALAVADLVVGSLAEDAVRRFIAP